MEFRLRPSQDALFLDIDGTILDIAPTPDKVVVPPGLIDDLARLYENLGGALALISGRSIENIYELFYPLRLPASGAHGAQWCIEGRCGEKEPLPEMVRQAVIENLSQSSGLIFEDKRYAMAVHYRNAPELADKIRQVLRDIVSANAEPLSVMNGKMVYEIVSPGHNKGTAIECFMKQAPFAGRRPVFLGDDETDIFAMDACEKLGGVSAYVGKNIASRHYFPSPSEVRSWLKRQVLS
jgi:trehalose 6-phosphate phosphatase